MSTLAPDPAHALTPSGNLRRRMLVSRVLTGGATASAILAVGVLALLVYTVIDRGGGQISWTFLTSNPPPGAFGSAGGGIAYAIVGSVVIVVLAAAIAVPTGVLTALFVTEFAPPRVGLIVQLSLDLLNGLPAIVIGVFVYGLLVAGHGQSGFAGSVGLSIIMIPLIARSSQEVLQRVPGTLREAADALGVSRWRTIIGIILPTALGGIVTGSLLGVARAAGETAPLLLVSSIFAPTTQFDPFGHSMPNIPVVIFQLAENGDPSAFPQAWGAALVLLTFILAANIGARLLLSRSKSGRLSS